MTLEKIIKSCKENQLYLAKMPQKSFQPEGLTKPTRRPVMAKACGRLDLDFVDCPLGARVVTRTPFGSPPSFEGRSPQDGTNKRFPSCVWASEGPDWKDICGRAPETRFSDVLRRLRRRLRCL